MYVRKLYDAVPGSKKVDSNAMPDNKMNMLVTRYATSSVLYLKTCSTQKRNRTTMKTTNDSNAAPQRVGTRHQTIVVRT